MTKEESIKIFEDRKVRALWDTEKEKWYFSLVDVIAVLTDQNNYQGARNYWKVLKFRLLKEGNEPVTNCNRLKSIKIRKELTDEWENRGIIKGTQFATLTDIITKAWADKTKASSKDISQAVNPETFVESKKVAQQGGNVAKVARQELEARTGKKVVTALNAKQAFIEKNKSEGKNE